MTIASKTRKASEHQSVATALLDYLHSLGVEHVFGVPGDYVLGFNKVMENHPDITFINTTRENTAGYLADAYARIRGLGVACITYGVGINIVNATAQAFVENSPVVIISGTAGVEEFHKSSVRHHLINKSSTIDSDTTQLEIFKHVTIAQAVLNDPLTAEAEIKRVIEQALWHKKPVYIELPRDMVNIPIPTSLSESDVEMWSTNHSEPLLESLQEVITLLKNTKKPIIWVGHLIQRFGLEAPLLEFAQKYQIPIVSTLSAKGTIDERDPLYCGVYQGELSRPEVKKFAESSDCALILGAVLNDVDTGLFTEHIGTRQRVVASDNSVAVGHHLYPNVDLTDFVEALSSLTFKKNYEINIPRKERKRKVFNPVRDQKIAIVRLMECLQSHISENIRVVADIGESMLASIDLEVHQHGFMCNSFFSSVGFAIPASIGASFADPDRRVIALAGDGAFQMTATELSTAVRYHVDPIVIVLNNHGYGMERPILDGKFNDLVNWNYSKLPLLLGGGKGVRVTTEDELEAALDEALHDEGTFWIIEVELSKKDFSPQLKHFGKILHRKK